MVGGNENVGKRLVVAQQHVEAGTQPLDQIGFEQQRLGLGGGRDEFERGGRRDHALDTRVVAARPGIGDDAFADVLGLADVEDVAVGIDHAVDAGRRRRQLGMAGNGGSPGGERTRRRQTDRPLPLGIGQRRFLVLLDEFGGRVDVFLPSVHAGKVSRGGCRGHRATRGETIAGGAP